MDLTEKRENKPVFEPSSLASWRQIHCKLQLCCEATILGRHFLLDMNMKKKKTVRACRGEACVQPKLDVVPPSQGQSTGVRRQDRDAVSPVNAIVVVPLAETFQPYPSQHEMVVLERNHHYTHHVPTGIVLNSIGLYVTDLIANLQ